MIEWLRKMRGGFHRTFWVANFTELFERLAYYGPQAILAIYLHEHLNLSSEQTTWLIGYYGLVVWIMPVIGGALADRFGFRRTLASAFIILAVGYFLLGSLSASWMEGIRDALPLFALMHVLMLIPALGPAIVKPVVVGTTARSAKEDVRSMGYSIYYTVVNIGATIGPLLASVVRKAIGVEDVFLVSSGVTLAMAIVTLLFYKEPARDGDVKVATIGESFLNLIRVFGNLRFVLFLLIFSGFWVMYWQQYISLSIFVRDYVDRNTDVDRLLAIEAATVIATQFLVTWLTRKVPAFTAMIVGVLISSLSWLVLTMGASPGFIAVMLIVLAIGEVTQAPRYYDYVSRLAPPGQQGLFMGYAFLPIGIGYGIAGLLAGRLIHIFGEVLHAPSAMWYVVTGVGLLTTALIFIYNKVAKPTVTTPEAQ